MATMADIINDCLTRLSMASGLDTQTYAEDRIKNTVQEKFNTLFDHLWWPQFLVIGEQFTLDGATGVVTADLTEKIKRYEDVKAVWYGNEPHPLPALPTNFNPNLSRRRAIAPINSAKIFRIMPVTTTGSIYATYRTKPDPYDLDDEVDMDKDLLVLATCYDYMEDDASNATSTAKFEKLFNARLKQFEKMYQQHQLDRRTPRGTSPVEEWTDAS